MSGRRRSSMPDLTPLPPPLVPIVPPLVPVYDLPPELPILTDVQTEKMNLDMDPKDGKAKAYVSYIKDLEAQLEMSSQQHSREYRIELFIGNWGKILKDHARKLKQELREQNMHTSAQAQMDLVVTDYVRELDIIKQQKLPYLVEQKMISAYRATTDLKIAAIDTPPGLKNAVMKINKDVLDTVKTYGFKGLFMIGKALDKYKIPAAKVADKAYVSAYWLFWSFLSRMLYHFAYLVIDPKTYMSMFGLGSDMSNYTIGNIVEVEGGGGRKTRKRRHMHGKSKHSKSKRAHKSRRK
jgi:hypothetical protein